ncbi:putative N-acetyltransferase camello isoform X1 [Vespula maculifrons]|uniref:N-acetyltransferase camello isoform X1 n=1 Tax=Vespula maculifrons TaxID=7453 RepID=A0ABD2CXU2_VESMC
MYNFILIRAYRQEDEPFCKELLKTGVMASLNATFIGFLSEEIALIIAVLICTTILILIGIPILYCLMVMSIPAFAIYIFLYTTFFYKARQIQKEVSAIPRIYMSDNTSHFWVAEAYEFYLLNRRQRDERCTFMTEEEFKESNIDVSRHFKKIVGTIALCKNKKLQNSAWIKRFSVHKDYRRKNIGIHLVNLALQFSNEHGYKRINVIISEYRVGAIKLFIKKGFELYLLHNKSLFTSLMTIEFHELTYRIKYYRDNELLLTNPFNVQSIPNN